MANEEEISSVTIPIQSLISALKNEGVGSLEVLQLVKKTLNEDKPIFITDDSAGQNYRLDAEGLTPLG